MAAPEIYRWRKASDIGRKHALFELLENEEPMLDTDFLDQGVFEITFNPGIGGKVMEWNQLLTLLDEGKKLAEKDR